MTENILEGIDTIVYNDKMWEDIKKIADKGEWFFPFGIRVMVDEFLPYNVIALVKNNQIVKIIRLQNTQD